MRRFDPKTDPIHHAISISANAKDLKTIKIHPALHEAMRNHWHVKAGHSTIRELAEHAIAFYIEPTGNGT